MHDAIFFPAANISFNYSTTWKLLTAIAVLLSVTRYIELDKIYVVPLFAIAPECRKETIWSLLRMTQELKKEILDYLNKTLACYQRPNFHLIFYSTLIASSNFLNDMFYNININMLGIMQVW